MLRTSHVLLAAIAGTIAAAHAGDLELHARIEPPPVRAKVTLRGTEFPYSAATSADSQGRFKFRGLEPGSYTVDVFANSEGEVRRTVTVSASFASPDGRVAVTIPFEPSERAAKRAVAESNVISFKDFCTPPFSKAQYEKAQLELGRRNIEGAREHLLRALKVAPEYVDAWNNLGTIAFQTGDYKVAERHFREALKHEPDAFSPLVNMGGTLLALNRNEEALGVNRKAHRVRPDDALANAHLGISYFRLGDYEAAVEHLKVAKRVDPAHFTYPQLVLARIYSRRGEDEKVVAELRDFLSRHPDSARSEDVRGWLQLIYESGDAALAEVVDAVGPVPNSCDW